MRFDAPSGSSDDSSIEGFHRQDGLGSSTGRTGLGSSWQSQAFPCGISHVLPSGCLSGLRCHTPATFAAR